MQTELVTNNHEANITMASHGAATTFTPHMDIVEHRDAIEIFVDMPGVKSGDLDIEIHNRELSLAGYLQTRNQGTKCLLQEFEVGNFHRTFQLSDGIDEGGITAELTGGVLRLWLPKVEDAKPRKIEVKET